MRPTSGTGKPLITEVARAVGVSPTTVSHAFNRPDRVAASTRARVLQVAAEMGYSGPDPTARHLRRGRADAIGVVYSDELGFAFEDPATAAILGGLSAACAPRELNMLLVPLGPPHGGSHAGAVGSAAVDGFVVYSVPETDRHIGLVLDRGLPTVIIDSPQDIPSGLFVGLDDHGAMTALGEYLTQLGHSSVGIITSRLGTARYNGATGPERWRTAPYVIQSKRILGLHEAVGGQLPVEERFDNSIAAGTQALHDLLDRHTELTAVCCTTDVLALGALVAAGQRGLVVPRDLTITGFDDLPEAGRVGLTTVNQPLAGKGRAAGELLLSAGNTPTDRRILPTSLEIRRTSGPARE
jgi:DNA-binding LacI/PurR family transcriptional regulator